MVTNTTKKGNLTTNEYLVLQCHLSLIKFTRLTVTTTTRLNLQETDHLQMQYRSYKSVEVSKQNGP